MKIRIEFELPDEPEQYGGYTQPSARLIAALRDVIDNEEVEALQWLSCNVLDTSVK